MKLGFFSPLPPSRTGVADYSAALLAHLQKLGEVVPNAPGDINLYHVGNNHLHKEIYVRALAEPGIIVLHDAVLQHFFLGTLDADAYVDEFIFNYGPSTRSVAQELWKNRARSAADPRYFAYPMLKRVATSAKAVIVHNPRAAEMVRAHAPLAPIHEIPHLFLAPPAVTPAELGLPQGTLLAGVFGHLRESKRLNVILRAFGKLWKEGVKLKLLVQGEFASTDLERALSGRLDDSNIIRVGYLAEQDFWRYAAATDLCLNLRFPSAGETSGIAISMMGIQKPVVFTAGHELARIPENACLKVEVGPTEEEQLTEILRWAATNPSVLPEIGQRAARHIQQEHNPERIAKKFWEVIRTR